MIFRNFVQYTRDMEKKNKSIFIMGSGQWEVVSVYLNGLQLTNREYRTNNGAIQLHPCFELTSGDRITVHFDVENTP
jgi:hypothetical protein